MCVCVCVCVCVVFVLLFVVLFVCCFVLFLLKFKVAENGKQGVEKVLCTGFCCCEVTRDYP